MFSCTLSHPLQAPHDWLNVINCADFYDRTQNGMYYRNLSNGFRRAPHSCMGEKTIVGVVGVGCVMGMGECIEDVDPLVCWGSVSE